MKLGEIWLSSSAKSGRTRQRPVVVIDGGDIAAGVAICPLSTSGRDAPHAVTLRPDPANGLMATSQIHLNLRARVPPTDLLRRVGVLADVDLGRLNLALSQLQSPLRQEANSSGE